MKQTPARCYLAIRRSHNRDNAHAYHALSMRFFSLFGLQGAWIMRGRPACF
ncbi:MAG: hypothetical protein Q7J77_11295 [Undibacterium sp.]|nr:hypothetical protein [Undibacterium sp.]